MTAPLQFNAEEHIALSILFLLSKRQTFIPFKKQKKNLIPLSNYMQKVV